MTCFPCACLISATCYGAWNQRLEEFLASLQWPNYSIGPWPITGTLTWSLRTAISDLLETCRFILMGPKWNSSCIIIERAVETTPKKRRKWLFRLRPTAGLLRLRAAKTSLSRNCKSTFPLTCSVIAAIWRVLRNKTIRMNLAKSVGNWLPPNKNSTFHWRTHCVVITSPKSIRLKFVQIFIIPYFGIF